MASKYSPATCLPRPTCSVCGRSRSSSSHQGIANSSTIYPLLERIQLRILATTCCSRLFLLGFSSCTTSYPLHRLLATSTGRSRLSHSGIASRSASYSQLQALTIHGRSCRHQVFQDLKTAYLLPRDSYFDYSRFNRQDISSQAIRLLHRYL